MPAGDEHRQRTTGGRRWWRIAPLLFILIIAVTIVAIWHWRLALAERLLPIAAETAGIELTAVSVDRLDLDGAQLSEIRFGPSGLQSIASATLKWTASGLRDRRLRTIEISGADLHVEFDDEGRLVSNGLLPPQETGKTRGAPVFPEDLPFERVGVSNSRIIVMLPDGHANIAVEGQLEVSPETLSGEISTQYSAETERGRGTGAGDASVSWAKDKGPAGEFRLAFDRLVTANGTGTNIHLAGSTEGLPARLEDISFRAEGSADRIEGQEFAITDVQMTASLSAGTLAVQSGGGILDWNVNLRTRLQPFDLTAPASLVLNADGNAAAVAQRLPRVSASGPVAIAIDAEISDPAALLAARRFIEQNPWEAASHVAGRLNLDAALQNLTLADTLSTGDVDAEISVNWSAGMLDVDVVPGAQLRNVTLASALAGRISPWVPNAFPFDIAVADGRGGAPKVRANWSEKAIEIRAVGGANVLLPEGTLELAIEGDATGSMADGLDRFDVKALNVNLASVPTKFGSVNGDIVVNNLSGDGANIAGAAAGEISVSDASVAEVSAHQVSVNFDGGLQLSPNEMSVLLSSDDRISMQDVRIAGGHSLPGATQIQLATGPHQFAISRGDGALTLDVRLAPGRVKLRTAGRNLGIAYRGATVTGTWPGQMNIDATDVKTDMGSGRRVDLAGLRVRAQGETSDVRVAVTLDGALPVLPGLTLPAFSGTANVKHKGPSLDGELAIAAAEGQPSLRARGRHNLKTGSGEGEILEAHLRFAPGVLQPEDLNPAIAGTMENVFASIALVGPIKWDSNGSLVPELTLSIDDLAASTESLDLFDARTSIVLTGAPEFTTPPGQQFTGQVRIGRLDPVPLDISFQLLPGESEAGPRLIVEKLQAELTEGRLSTNRFELVPPSVDTDLTLHVEGADLARAFAVIGVAGVGGKGKISGEVPVMVRGNQIAISGGRLTNDGPGEIFYDIAALPQSLIERDDTVTLVLQALSNFSYDELRIDMDKALDGPGTLRTRLTGANPDVLENHPFIFNINFESNFDRLAALVLEGLTTSQGLLRALALSPGAGAGSDVSP